MGYRGEERRYANLTVKIWKIFLEGKSCLNEKKNSMKPSETMMNTIFAKAYKFFMQS